MLINDDKILKSIVHKLMNFEGKITVPIKSEREVHTLVDYLRYEHTILFHLGEVKYTFFARRNEVVLHPKYCCPQTEYEKYVKLLANEAVKIKSNVCRANTPRDRELYVHDFLCTNVVYSDEGVWSHSIVGPLLYRRGVCDGISKTAKVLLYEAGIKAHVISGTACAGSNAVYEPHAWNIVCFGGNMYHLDVTFDNTLSNAGCIRHDYFNLTAEEIKKDHVIDSKLFNTDGFF